MFEICVSISYTLSVILSNDLFVYEIAFISFPIRFSTESLNAKLLSTCSYIVYAFLLFNMLSNTPTPNPPKPKAAAVVSLIIEFEVAASPSLSFLFAYCIPFKKAYFYALAKFD